MSETIRHWAGQGIRGCNISGRSFFVRKDTVTSAEFRLLGIVAHSYCYIHTLPIYFFYELTSMNTSHRALIMKSNKS